MRILAGYATWQGSKKIGRENGNSERNEAKAEQLEGTIRKKWT
jgi:hypothetical protein